MDHLFILQKVNPETLDTALRAAYGEAYRGVSTAPQGGPTTLTTAAGEPTLETIRAVLPDGQITEYQKLVPAPEIVVTREGPDEVWVTVHLADDADPGIAAHVIAGHDPDKVAPPPPPDPDLALLHSIDPAAIRQDTPEGQILAVLVEMMKRRLS